MTDGIAATANTEIDAYAELLRKCAWLERLAELRGDLMIEKNKENAMLRFDRDALARRCAEQAKHIADLLAMIEDGNALPDPTPAPTVCDAIAVMQRGGIR